MKDSARWVVGGLRFDTPLKHAPWWSSGFGGHFRGDENQCHPICCGGSVKTMWLAL